MIASVAAQPAAFAGCLALADRSPGAAGRGSCTDVFRKKILELREAQADLDLRTFAEAVAVPCER